MYNQINAIIIFTIRKCTLEYLQLENVQLDKNRYLQLDL